MQYGKQHTDGSRSGGQPPAPRLLTEAEWQRISAPLGLTSTVDQIASALRERGLIAEPVDPLIEEADNLASEHHVWDTRADYQAAKTLALAALRRGKELAKPLTREMVAAAWERYAVNGPYGADGLHAALVEQMK